MARMTVFYVVAVVYFAVATLFFVYRELRQPECPQPVSEVLPKEPT